MNIEVNEKAIRTLFSDDFWFNIPSYQRPYVWGKDNIIDLLDDIVYAFKYNPQDKYFLGSLVLQEKNKYEYDILDGQQRLTTLCIFMAVLRDLAKDSSLKDALQSLLFAKGNKFKGIKDKARLTFEIRNEVEEFFQNCIIKENGTYSIEEFIKLNNISDTNISIKNISKAIFTIREFIENNECDVDFEHENFFNFIYENLIFAYVCSDTREQAFRLFTILNNRGIPLTTADILKSLNLDKVEEKERREYAKKWEELEEKYGEKFDRFLNFVRTIKLKEKVRKNLLEEFEEKIYKKGLMNYGKTSIDYLKITSDNYDKLISFDMNLDGLDNRYKNLVTIMKIGFNSEEWIPAILYYYEKFKLENLYEFTKFLDNKFMGDWINRETAPKRLENMSKILKYIELAKTSNEVIENRELFEFDKDRFFYEINGNIYGQRYCKYLLLKVENYKMDNDMAFISEYKNISVEHILPQNPKAESLWRKEFTDEERGYWTNKLANLMLIPRRKNSQLSNSEFEDKKKRYKKENLTIFPSNNHIYLNTKKWNILELEKRQIEINEIFGNFDIDFISQTKNEEILRENKTSLNNLKGDNREKIIEFILKNDKNLCDDCLSDELEIYPRQTVNQIANVLKDDERFNREKTICDRCNGNKLVLMKK